MACDQHIEASLVRLAAARTVPEAPLPPPRHRESNPNAPAFDIRGVLYRVVGTDLTQLSGIGSYLALKLIAECGLDMTRWPTAKHFTSWLALSPGNKISGGKVLSSRTWRTKSRAAALLRLAAVTLSRTATALGAARFRNGRHLAQRRVIGPECSISEPCTVATEMTDRGHPET